MSDQGPGVTSSTGKDGHPTCERFRREHPSTLKRIGAYAINRIPLVGISVLPNSSMQ
jgi:hypothetical protein